MYKNLLYFLFLTSSFSCVRSLTPSKNEKNEEKITEYSEDLSVFRPKYNTNDIKEEEKPETKNTEKKSTNTSTQIKDDNAAVETILEQIKETNKKLADGKGYRIQVFSGNTKADFENAKSYLFRYFSDLEVYESYSQPTYKIKVGDFLSVAEAEKYAGSLKQKFGTVRIISDKINIKKALDIK